MLNARPRGDVKPTEEIKVHVTQNGGFYVDADELMHSKQARKAIAEMREIYEIQAGCTPSPNPGSGNRGSNTSAP